MFNSFLKGIIFLSSTFFLSGCSAFHKSVKKESIILDIWDLKRTPAHYQLVWNDEFEYDGLPDSTRWSFDTKGNDTGWGNNELQFYTASQLKNAFVANGCLHIVAHKEAHGLKHYTSARLITKGHGQWLYGRIECRAKLPTGRGTWPAFWMMPAESAYGTWPASGEIDIMENVGFDPDTVLATTHTQLFNHISGTSVSGKHFVPSCAKEFHVYAIEWDEHEIRGYVDEHHYYTYTNTGKGWKSWPFDKPFYIILNLAIGDNWGGRMGVDDSIFPCTYEIDFVRVYQER